MVASNALIFRAFFDATSVSQKKKPRNTTTTTTTSAGGKKDPQSIEGVGLWNGEENDDDDDDAAKDRLHRMKYPKN